MISRVSGTLRAVEGLSLTLEADAAPLWLELLAPAYLAERLAPEVGRPLSLHTFFYMESQAQGAWFAPRLLAFETPADRRFFELLTSVKGLGNRRALRAMAREPGWIAGAVLREDPKALQSLPEIGKRLAETIITDLRGKCDAFAPAQAHAATPDNGRPTREPKPAHATGPASEAAAALIALGESRHDADRMVSLALERGAPADDTQAILALACGMRGR